MYNQVMSENTDLKEQLASYQAKEVEANTTLETMRKQIEKFAIDNKPNEPVKKFEDMTPLERFRATK
jgi:LPS O-antigen subunit length determinant protein (WzzB/FepE family)